MDSRKRIAHIVAIVETAAEVKEVIAGHMFAAFQAHGISLDEFNSLLSEAVKAGFLQSVGRFRYSITELAKQVEAARREIAAA